MRVIFLLFFVIKTIIFQNLESHGFRPFTYVVKQSESKSENPNDFAYTTMNSIFEEKESIFGWVPNIIAYDEKTKKKYVASIDKVGVGKSPCYVRMSLGKLSYDKKKQKNIFQSFETIECSLFQQFYVKDVGCIEAQAIKIGDELENYNNHNIVVYSICLIEKETQLITFSVGTYNTFYVGKYGVLVHNFAVPAVELGFGFAFGGPTVGGGLLSGLEWTVSCGIGTGVCALIYGYNWLTQTTHFSCDMSSGCMSFAKAIFTNQSPYDYWNTPVSEILQKSNDYTGSRSSQGGQLGENEPPRCPCGNFLNSSLSVNKERHIGNNKEVRNKDVKKAADDLGFSLVHNKYLHGQLVFKKGNKYISLDVDSHRGSYWKVFRLSRNQYELIEERCKFFNCLFYEKY
jgi:hypothetical protein